jgi:hypothetical protein
MIAESLYSQVDADGREFILMKEIVDPWSDESAVPVDVASFVDPNGRTTRRMTTKGWKLLVEWKDGTTDWLSLKDLKESYPVQVVEYTVANNIVEQPAFAWWVPYVLRKRERIIHKVKTRLWKCTHKYGVELPKSVKQALAIDRNTETSFCKDTIEKEMKNVLPAFEFRDDDVMPPGFKKINCHMVFDVKLDLVRTARFVAGGHQTDPLKESVYSSFISCNSVRLAFLIAALNDLEILSADVQNAYLNAPTKEKIYTTVGPELGQGKEGRPVMIVRALYGLRSSKTRRHDHLAATFWEASFKACKVDANVWMRPAIKADGSKYYEYVLCYVDDILVVSERPKRIMVGLKANSRRGPLANQ